jgi:hypothetical protein
MTVKGLINELTSWVKNGHLDMDSNVYLTDSNFPFEDARLFSTTLCGMSEPFHDKDDQTKRCAVFCGKERVPHFAIQDGENGWFKDYGGFLIKGNHTKEEEDELIRKADFDWLRHILDEHDKENAQNSFCNDGK